MSLSNIAVVENTIKGQHNNVFASQVDFTPSLVNALTSRWRCSEDELEHWAGNHLKYAHSLGNVEEYMHDDSLLALGGQLRYAHYDEEAQIVYDRFGVGWKRDTEGVFACVHPLFDDDNLKDYYFPEVDAAAMIEVEKVAKKWRSKYYVVGFQHIGLFERAWTLRGYENFMLDLYLRPSLAHTILDGILAYKMEEARLFVKSGVHCVRTGDDWGTQRNLAMSPQHWREFILPRQRQLWEIYRQAGMPIMHHSCGDITLIIPDLIEAGVDVLHPIQPAAMSVDTLVREYGRDLVFFGGIDTQELLPNGTPEEIKDEVRRLAELFAQTRGWIIAPSQEVMTDVPLDNVTTLIEVIAEVRGRGRNLPGREWCHQSV